MFTVCPKCALTLVVTAADLRVAQGYVRCGRCSNVFNALARLTDDRHAAPAAAPLEAAGGPPQAPEEPVAEDAILEDALEFNPDKTDITAVFVEPPPNPEWTAATGSFKAMIAASQAPAQVKPAEPPADVEIVSGFVASMLQDEPASAVSAPGPETPDTEVAPPQAEPQAPAPQSSPPGAARSAEPADDTERDFMADDDTEEAPPRTQLYAWHVAAGLAALVLLAQIAHHNREALAANAHLNRALTAIYAALGSPLVPRWDLNAYDVRQLGASVDAGGAGLITVRASIRNAAQRAQPLPFLRVTLQDRFGNRLASSDVPPRSYVPHTARSAGLIPGGERIDAEMAFVDPGASAVGFEIDACLPAHGGGVTCANDVTAR